jgi:2-oxo-4-hydroxy-4-carboxy--5-ureidoimidazoline (OHCU) decarboxylase
MQFTSVKVTPEAQKAFLEKHPQLAKKTLPAGSSTTSSASTSRPLEDITKSHKKKQLKRNAADMGADSVPVSKKAKKM